ncbi:MAG: 7-carboxy-7-deazaguanine synthase QueE [Planctomycetota bacterium]
MSAGRATIVSGQPQTGGSEDIAAIVRAARASDQVADLTEIFASLQGEGVVAGQVHLFLRFAGCDLRCVYCDTPGSLSLDGVSRGVRIGGGLLAEPMRREPNPLSFERLLEIAEDIGEKLGFRPLVALTGGEPLLRVPFLERLIPELKRRGFQVLLETAGTRAPELERIVSDLDWVSMDLKLPSVAREGDRFDQHEAFLRVAHGAGRRIQVKVVIGPELDLEELERAVSLVAGIDTSLPFILQPEFKTLKASDPNHQALLRRALAICRAHLEDVRVLPQLHKYLGLL